MHGTEKGPLSAFTVRRTTRASARSQQTPLADATGGNVVNAIQKSSPENESCGPSHHKKRKTKYWAAQNPSNRCRAEKRVQTRVEPMAAEKDVESENEETPELSSLCEASVYQLSTFVPSKDNVLGETTSDWTIRLNFMNTVTLVGQYDIWVRSGAVNILGAAIHAGPRLHRVYATSTNSLPSISWLQNPSGPQNQSAVITILACSSRIRLLRELSPKFRGIWNRNAVPSKEARPTIDSSHRSFLFIKNSTDDLHQRQLHPLEIPDDWQKMINNLRSNERRKPPAVIICGPLGSGKSTFGRILANSLLQNCDPDLRLSKERGLDGVAFLDLDPGQPEYSPPGEVSLVHLRSYNLGVPFTHPMICYGEDNKLIRAHHIGHVSLKDDPVHYKKCGFELLNQYKKMLSRYPSCPLIVNCSGWVQGSGLEVLVEFIRHWAFTNIVYTSTLGPTEVVETLVETGKSAGIPFCALTTQPYRISTRTAADLRMMRTLSYFHLGEPEGGNLRWNTSLITEIPPVTVRYAGPRQDILGIMVFGEEQNPEFLAGILEGSVVGLIALEDETAILCEEGSRSMIDQDSEADDVVESDTAERVRSTALQIPVTSDTEPPQSSSIESDTDSSRQRRRRPSPRSGETGAAQVPIHLQHRSILRTPEDLPYLTTGIGTNSPPNPTKSHSIGQALVRSIDPSTKTLQLITPILQQTFQALRQTSTEIVLARGKLDTPTWAYREEYCAAVSRRRRENKTMVEETEQALFDGTDEITAWSARTPWADVVDGKDPKGSGAKVWKVRRDFKPRSSGDD